LVLSVLLLVIGAASIVAAQDDDGEQRNVRVIVKHHQGQDCDQVDCSESDASVWVGVGEDGDSSEVIKHRIAFRGTGETLEGDSNVWFSSDETGGFLGVQLTELTDALRTHFGVPTGAGVMIAEVVEGSPAEQAGFQAGDVITAVDGSEVANGRALSHKVRGFEEGETVAFEVVRDGALQILNATLAERETSPRMMRILGDDAVPFGNSFTFCDEDDEDCDIEALVEKLGGTDHAKVFELDGLDLSLLHCGEGENCEIKVTCENDDCACTVDGAKVACDDLERNQD